jgi:hypothetical protein
MAPQDRCLAAENLMLAAFGCGPGTCRIGLTEAWLNQRAGKAALEIPAAHAAVAQIVVALPRGERRPRRGGCRTSSGPRIDKPREGHAR